MIHDLFSRFRIEGDVSPGIADNRNTKQCGIISGGSPCKHNR